MQCLDEKNQRIKELENENRKLQDKVESLEHNVQILTQAVLQAVKQRFGASTEKTPVISGQCFLFGELIDVKSEETDNKVVDIKEHKRPTRKKGDRDKLVKSLPHEVIECVLNEDEALCKVCGSDLKIIGKKKVRSEIEYIPAKLIMKDYVQYVYKCIECGKGDSNPFDYITSAHVPAPVLPHSFASPSIVSWVMYEKYVMSIPLYRQEKDFKRMGCEIKRDMMANWMIRSSEYWLKPLYDAMHRELLKSNVIMSDETTWQVNKEAGKLASSNSFIWVHRTGGCEEKAIILYQYTSSRAGDHAKKFLEGFNSFHVSDAYAGYEKVEEITRCLCFSHLRRYYIEAIPLDSKKKEIPGSGGAIGRNFCDKLFKLEKQWKKLSPEERKKNRLIKSVPILDAFFAWAENTNTNNSNLKKAFKYTLNHREYFTNFLLNGEIPLSNNLSEQAVKPVAITRKNSLFSDSVDGAKASAIIFSIVNTAAANNIDAYKYLEYIFKNLPNSKFPLEPSVLEEYLPWSDKIQAHCKVNTEEESYSESA